MSDDEADDVGAATANAYAAEFDEDDYDESVFTKSGKRAKVEEKGAWCLVVKMTFSSAEKVESFKGIFATYVKYIQEDEPTTLSYQALYSDKEPLVVTMFERYKDKSYGYTVAHRTTPEFRTFRAALEELGPVLDGHSSFERVQGFMTR